MGDPACHLSSVCISCGKFVEGTSPPACPHCGELMDGGPAGVEGHPVFQAGHVNTILYCDAFMETVEFYRRFLRLQVSFANQWFVEFRLADRATMSIVDAARATVPAVEGKGMTLSLRVSDLDDLRQRLTELGIPATDISRRFGSRVFDMHDPEGHRIEFWTE